MSELFKTRWFILKDFIGYPTDIVSAKYVKGMKRGGAFYAPQRLSKKFSGFNSVEEILEYKMCSCGKDTCEVNELLKKLVLSKLNKITK